MYDQIVSVASIPAAQPGLHGGHADTARAADRAGIRRCRDGRDREAMFRASVPILRNVHSQVADGIGAGIVRGDIPPGEALPSELRLCETLEVSRTVVREAIRTLTGKGLVESRAKSGTRVRPPEEWNHLDPDVLRWRLEAADVNAYLAKLFQLRNTVEPAAAAIAATAATPACITRLRQALEGMEAARAAEDFVVADIAFHKGIYFATRNEFFWPVAQMFDIFLRRSFVIAAAGDHRPRGLAEHRDVLAAIERKDPAAARRKAVLLLNHSAEDLVRIRGTDPFGGSPLPPGRGPGRG
jgi:DNA-binding FadR family transcriptional regulator